MFANGDLILAMGAISIIYALILFYISNKTKYQILTIIGVSLLIFGGFSVYEGKQNSAFLKDHVPALYSDGEIASHEIRSVFNKASDAIN
ncbi:hypothetical protein [Thiomicrorhabdus xiamenensis]|uniref:Uncharacterized protein n=1 Tax=Thiomicrorhabdus xiamenensis TaxID=2739063 RepID=A0A7D4NQU0_9GAMM|nr:hypothetical protein [Thiomicrorhabdus xiamenensis]QKI89511.1 hypothetical protein HQN79_07975 [Thiomicrorhabdus xiamenensis]